MRLKKECGYEEYNGVDRGPARTRCRECWLPAVMLWRDEQAPAGFSSEAWQQLSDDGGRVLDRWGSEAARLGWSALDLFGCHPDPEFACVRWDCMGAVTLAAMTGVPVVEVHSDLIRHLNGTAYRRKDLSHAVPIWARS
jgi:hypothetical protein